MSNFSVPLFVRGLVVDNTDEAYLQIKKSMELIANVFDDAYLARAYYWGVASAMENQLTYLGGNMLPNLERKLNTLNETGYLGESDLSEYRFANEDRPHVNEDTTLDDQVNSAKNRIDILQEKMVTAAVVFVEAIRAHDDISKDLGQLTYSAIKARASDKRAANERKSA